MYIYVSVSHQLTGSVPSFAGTFKTEATGMFVDEVSALFSMTILDVSGSVTCDENNWIYFY